MQNAFPIRSEAENITPFKIEGDLENITNNKVNYNTKHRPFEDVGLMINREVLTGKFPCEYDGKQATLGSILQSEKEVPEEFFISESELEKWKYLKGAKKELRTASNGHEYYYSEGPVTFPDDLNKPSRTIITGEGGKSPSRFKHVVKTKSGKLRRLTPIELEKLNMFPPNHTVGAPDTKRAFFMGNALVVGVVKKLGQSLYDFHK